MLMSHLSATLRTLVSVGLPLTELMERASRVFCESTLPTHYATLVCACLCPNGDVEVCNAGHPPPLVLGPGRQSRLEAKALPIGMFCEGRFSTETVRLAPGDTLFLYTDGLIEAEDATGADFGVERVVRSAAAAAGLAPAEMVDGCLRDLAAFRGVAASADDLTIMAVRRV